MSGMDLARRFVLASGLSTVSAGVIAPTAVLAQSYPTFAQLTLADQIKLYHDACETNRGRNAAVNASVANAAANHVNTNTLGGAVIQGVLNGEARRQNDEYNRYNWTEEQCRQARIAISQQQLQGAANRQEAIKNDVAQHAHNNYNAGLDPNAPPVNPNARVSVTVMGEHRTISAAELAREAAQACRTKFAGVYKADVGEEVIAGYSAPEAKRRAAAKAKNAVGTDCAPFVRGR